MKLIKMKCPSCGASFKVEKGQKEFFCEFCRTTTLLDDGVVRVEHTIIDKNKEEGLKIFKGIGITSLIYFGIIMVVVIAVIGVIIFNIIKMNKRTDGIFDNINNQMNDIQEDVNGSDIEIDKVYSQIEIQMFNSFFELYSGTKTGFFIEGLLDNIVTNNKTEAQHIITVMYRDINTSNSDDIVDLKHTLEDNQEYEVSLDYDNDGFVNRVTIVDLK